MLIVKNILLLVNISLLIKNISLVVIDISQTMKDFLLMVQKYPTNCISLIMKNVLLTVKHIINE